MDAVAPIVGPVFDWLAENESVFSAIAALIVIVGVLLSPMGAGVRRFLRQTGGEAPAPDAAIGLPPDPRRALASIAVLPFEVVAGETGSELNDKAIGEGLAADTITALSGGHDIHVASRLASFPMQGRPAAEIADALQVRYVVTGHLRRVGKRVRVTVELIDCESHRQIWSDRFDTEASGLLGIESDVAEKIAATVGGEAVTTSIREVGRRATDDVDAWTLQHKALTCFFSFSPEAFEEGLACARKAYELDPEYGAAYAVAAHIIMERQVTGNPADFEEAREEALALVEKALRASPDDYITLVHAGSVLAHCAMREESIRTLRRALKKAPQDLVAWGLLARSLTHSDRSNVPEAHRIADALIERAPNHVLGFLWHVFKAAALSRDHDYAAAALEAKKSVEWVPTFTYGLMLLANALAATGDREGAAEALAKARATHKFFTPRTFEIRWGREAAGQQVIEDLMGGLKRQGLMDLPARASAA